MKVLRLKKTYQKLEKAKLTRLSEKKQLQKLEEILQQYLQGTRLRLVMSQLKASFRTAKGLRWTHQDKSFALQLLHSSPKSYRILRKALALPSVKTLRTAVNKLAIYPGFCPTILAALKAKTQTLPESARLVCLAMDEMSLRQGLAYDARRDEVEGLGKDGSFLNCALVFVARGLTHRWKQPFGYFLTSGTMPGTEIHKLISQAIDELERIGLNVLVTLSDQGSNNRSNFETHLNISVEKPYFMRGNKKVFVLYDPPHLIKSIRNNLKNKGFVVDGKDISWKHIQDFYSKDSSKPTRLAPKLTRRHLELPPFSTLRVCLATQVISHSVATGMKVMAQWGLLDDSAHHTADFLENFDQLFNAFNSSSFSSPAKMRHALSQTSGHIAFLENIYPWVQSIKFKGRKLPCLDGWLISINALLGLWGVLHEDYAVKFLMTRQLNQDCVENLFSLIRSNGGARDNPDPQQFRAALRQVMVDSVMSRGNRPNCEDDLDHFLLTLDSWNEPKPLTEASLAPQGDGHPTPADISRMMPEVTLPPSEELSMQETNTLAYIGGYIVRKVSGRICASCRDAIISTDGIDDEKPAHEFLAAKLLQGTKEGLKVPSDVLVVVLEKMELVYQKVINDVICQPKVKETLTSLLTVKVPELDNIRCSECRVHLLVLHLMINIRLHHTIRVTNKTLLDLKQRKNRKLLKFSNL